MEALPAEALIEKLTADQAQAEALLQRTSAALVAAQDRLRSEVALALSVLAPLPDDVIEDVFLLVPPEQRMRCREVCKGWLAFLGRRRLWITLDLQELCLCGSRRATMLLNAAALRATGTSRRARCWRRARRA
jgi:hypothetical protein